MNPDKRREIVCALGTEWTRKDNPQRQGRLLHILMTPGLYLLGDTG